MKQGIHPNYVDCTITCACGNVIKTRSTKPEIHVEVCSKCHPFYTGKQKLVDTGGRVERFNKRFGRKQLQQLQGFQERRSLCGERRSFCVQPRKLSHQRKRNNIWKRTQVYLISDTFSG